MVDVVWMVAECTSVLGLYVRGVGYDGVLHGASEAFFFSRTGMKATSCTADKGKGVEE